MIEATSSDVLRPAHMRYARRTAAWLSRNGLFVAFLALVAWGASSSGQFLTWSNISVILEQSSTIAIVAVPSALLLMAGHVDLSIGSTMAIAAAVAAVLFPDLGLGAPFIGMLVAIAVGVINGYLSTYLRMSPIIVTLGTLTAFRGITFVVTGGLPESGFGSAFAKLGGADLGPLPVPVVIAAVVLIVGTLFLYQTRSGRHTRALGVSVNASFVSGIKIYKLPFTIYLFTAAAAGLAGLIEMSRLDSAPPTLGTGFEIQVLTAILLGGVAFGGGGGSMFGVLIGVLFLGTLYNTLILNSIEPFWVTVATGLALVFAAALNVFTKRLAARRRGGSGGRDASLKVGFS